MAILRPFLAIFFANSISDFFAHYVKKIYVCRLNLFSLSIKRPVRLFGTPEYVVYDKIWVLPPLEQGNSLLQNDPFLVMIYVSVSTYNYGVQ